MPSTIHTILNALGSVLITPWIRWSLWTGLIVASLLTALAALLVYRACSNQEGIRSSRNRSISALLDIPLYGEYPAAVFPGIATSLASASLYLAHALKPLLILGLPLTWALIQLGAWFTWQPFQPNETIIATATLNEGVKTADLRTHLSTSPEITVTMEAVHIPAQREISWRLEARSAGDGWLNLHVADRIQRIAIPIGIRPARITPKLFSPLSWHSLLYGAPAMLDLGGAVQSFHIHFPERRFTVGIWSLHWIVVFLVLTLAFGLALSIPLKVEL